MHAKCKMPELTGTQLKWIAAAAMLLDHIHYMFGFTGRVPDLFSMAGRIAAPLFLFCLCEGFAYTRSRARYFLRVYLLGAAMGALQFFMRFAGFAARADGFFPENNMLSAFSMLMVVFAGMDMMRARRVARGLALALVPWLWPFAANAIFARLPIAAQPAAGLLCWSFFPLFNMTGDTSIPVLITGVVLYALRGHRRAQAAGFALWTMLWDFCFVWRMASAMPGFEPVHMLTHYYEWLGVLAAPLMLCYHGRRGSGHKAFFYAFYPGHVYALYALSCAMYAVIGG